MKIGVIGIGNVGGTIARKLSAAGHDVRVANSSGAASVRSFAEDIRAKAVDVQGVVDGVDVIILSIPLPAVQKLPVGLFDAVPAETVIIDTSNYYPGMRDARISDIENGMVESVWVSEQINRPVIKAFNNVLAYTLAELGQPEGTPGRLAIAVAGDDPQAKQTTMDLVNQAGFDPVDAGTLKESWRQQPSTPAYCCDFDAETLREALKEAMPGVAPKIRDQMPEFFAKLGPNPTHADVIAMNRAINRAPRG